MKKSEKISIKMDQIKVKREKMLDYIAELNKKEISSTHVRENRDDTRMAGVKYDEYHETTKKIIKSCVDKVKKEKENAIDELNKKIRAYDSELVTLGASYGIALLSEEAENVKDKINW